MSIITLIKDITQIMFFITATIGTFYGFSIWRKELKGKTEYEIAKNVLVYTYRVRDAIEACQSPIMFSGEYQDRKAKENESLEEKNILNSWYAYVKRFEKVIEERNKLYEYKIEAKAIFGQQASDKIDKLLSCVKELALAISIYHEFSLKKLGDPELLRKKLNILYGISKIDNKDKENINFYDDENFKLNLINSIKEIEIYFFRFLQK